MANSSSGISFNEMIQADRKKRRQELAQSMLGSGRGTASGRRTPTVPSLSSRIGVTKRSSSAQPKSNIDGRWGHDLHHINNPRSARPAQLRRTRTPLAAGTLSTLERELGQGRDISIRSTASNFSAGQTNPPQTSQLNIKGMANPGPFVIVASNFAPGTTAADIQAAMEPVGGNIESCILISSHPTVMCELLFTDKAGAENVVATFNNQKADGRLLYVYHKQGGPSPQLHPLHHAATQSKPSASPLPATTEPVFDPPKGPRASNPRDAAPVSNNFEERESMDVDDEPGAAQNEQQARDQRYDDRGRNRDRYREADRNGYVGGRYGFGNQWNRRDNRGDYGRGGPRGLYSDGVYRNDRRYRS